MQHFIRSTFPSALFILFLCALCGCDCSKNNLDEISPEVAAPNSVDYSVATPKTVPFIKTEKDFQQFVESNPIAVVKFGATWCPPCRALGPELEKQAGFFESKNVQFAEIDVDELTELAKKLDVQAIPDVRVYLDGSEIQQILGYDPHTLANFIASICQDVAPSSETSASTVDDSKNRSENERKPGESAAEENPTPSQNAEESLEKELWPTE